MKILMVASEYAPLAKTGGLADATAGLGRALCAAGHDVRILLPDYASVAAPASTTLTLDDGTTLARVDRDDGRPGIYLHGVPDLAGSESLYTGDARDAHRFAALALAAAQLPEAIDWDPGLYHCHDWHAALVPAALAARQRGDAQPPTVLTLHNIGYQGDFPAAVLAAPAFRPLAERLALARQPRINFLTVGLETADELTTVSPTYAREVLTPEFGMGLDPVLVHRRNALTGILNGVDYAIWDPRHDPYLVHHYSSAGAPQKLEIKRALCRRFGLDAERPLVGLVSRLAVQKGIDLLAGALPRLLASTDCAFTLLGSGDGVLESELIGIAERNRGRVSYLSGHNELVAHEIIAGSDFLLVPSRYEPCGLTQLYALRFGTIPIVRATGGLADTVRHFDAASGLGNGCVFNDADPAAIVWAVGAALEWFRSPSAWRTLQTNAMEADHSWAQRVDDYLAVYARACRRSAL